MVNVAKLPLGERCLERVWSVQHALPFLRVLHLRLELWSGCGCGDGDDGAPPQRKGALWLWLRPVVSSWTSVFCFYVEASREVWSALGQSGRSLEGWATEARGRRSR